MRARIRPLPENSKENEDLYDVVLDHLIFDLVKVISLRILQIMHSSRRPIPHPQWYTCHQCQYAQQDSGLRPALCVSLIYINVHMLYSMCFFSVLCFRYDFHKAVILFLKQLPYLWQTLPGGGRDSPLLK